MKSVLVSIVSLVFLSIVVDVVLAKSATNKFIKGILGFVMVIVLVNPIKDMVDKMSESKDDVSIVYLINQSRVETMLDSIDVLLKQNGIDGVYVEIDMNMYDFDSSICGVRVYLDNLVLLDEVEHIHISDEILKYVQSIVDVDRDKVVFYE